LQSGQMSSPVPGVTGGASSPGAIGSAVMVDLPFCLAGY
jgi:hypothetical protein